MMMSSRGRWGAEEVKQILSRICTEYCKEVYYYRSLMYDTETGCKEFG